MLTIYKAGSSEIIEIKGDKQPIGVHVNNNAYTHHSIQLEKGDAFYLLSDGFQDQFGGPNGKKLKTAPLKELIVSISNSPFTQQEKLLKTRFDNWKGEQEQVYDVCIIGIRV